MRYGLDFLAPAALLLQCTYGLQLRKEARPLKRLLNRRMGMVGSAALLACRFPGVGERVTGPQPEHLSYSSFVSFRDPDGNSWVL
jgi:hypothetical protein